MGLSRIEIGFLSRALKAGVLPSGGDLLEVGESQVVPVDAAGDLLSILAPLLPAPRVEEAERRISAASRSKSQYQNAFGSARALYPAIFDPNSYAAIDLEPGPRRFCFDLNEPVTIDREFDCVINNGTSEHIFNQANVFESIHDCTRPGGLMIHWTPCFGWLNHGFYNVQPTLFFDLVAANDYDAQLVCVAGTDACVPIASAEEAVQAVRRHPSLTESLVCAVLRKQRQASFQVPLQGGYHQPAGVLRLARSPQSRLRPLGPNLALGRPAKQSSTSAWSWHDDPPMDASGGNDGPIQAYF